MVFFQNQFAGFPESSSEVGLTIRKGDMSLLFLKLFQIFWWAHFFLTKALYNGFIEEILKR
jgi:hypothetical protein